MRWPRLEGRGSLATAMQQGVQGALGDLGPAEKRGVEPRVSSNPGALSRARKRWPREAAEAVCDQVFARLVQWAQARGDLLSRWFLVDGCSMRLPHTAALEKAYPPGGNQPGEAHGPVIRVLTAHPWSSGLAVRPCWGPMFGGRSGE